MWSRQSVQRMFWKSWKIPKRFESRGSSQLSLLTYIKIIYKNFYIYIEVGARRGPSRTSARDGFSQAYIGRWQDTARGFHARVTGAVQEYSAAIYIYIYIYRARPELGRRIERFSQESDKENGLRLLPFPMDCLREISSPRAGRTIA